MSSVIVNQSKSTYDHLSSLEVNGGPPAVPAKKKGKGSLCVMIFVVHNPNGYQLVV